MFTIIFWKLALERAVKSAAQSMVLYWGAGALNVWEANWGAAAGIAGGALVLSLLTSVASSAFGDSSSPSLVEENPVPDAVRAVKERYSSGG